MSPTDATKSLPTRFASDSAPAASEIVPFHLRMAAGWYMVSLRLDSGVSEGMLGAADGVYWIDRRSILVNLVDGTCQPLPCNVQVVRSNFDGRSPERTAMRPK